MNRKTLIITSVSVAVAVVISLTLGLPLYFHYSSIHYPPITIVSYELNPEAGEEWTLNVTTWLPNSCFYMKETTIDISEKQDLTVFITLKAKNVRGLCAQMIKELNYLFEIIYPLPGVVIPS